MSTRRGFLVACFLALACSAFSLQAKALDRFGQIGQGIRFPFQVDPNFARADEVYTLELAYFLTERWATTFAVDLEMRGTERSGLAFGAQGYFWLDGNWLPFGMAEFIYLVDPKNDLGWRVFLGLEWNLHRLTKIDNLRLSAKTGASALYLDQTANEIRLIPLSLTLFWAF